MQVLERQLKHISELKNFVTWHFPFSRNITTLTCFRECKYPIDMIRMTLWELSGLPNIANYSITVNGFFNQLMELHKQRYIVYPDYFLNLQISEDTCIADGNIITAPPIVFTSEYKRYAYPTYENMLTLFNIPKEIFQEY